MVRRCRTRCWRLALARSALHAPAQAQSYPSRTITIVVSIGGRHRHGRAGAALCREAFGRRSASRWWSRTSPAPRPCWRRTQVATAPPDGHTLVVLTSAALAINPTLYKQINYDPEQRFRADLALREIAVHPGRQSRAAGQDRAGVHQIRQGSRDRR